MAKKKTVKKRAVKTKKAVKRRKRAVKGWTAEEVKLLKNLFPNNPTTQIAAQFGRSSDAVKKKASRMGLRKSKKYLKKLGRA